MKYLPLLNEANPPANASIFKSPIFGSPIIAP